MSVIICVAFELPKVRGGGNNLRCRSYFCHSQIFKWAVPNFGLNKKDDPCWCEKNIAALTFFLLLLDIFPCQKLSQAMKSTVGETETNR